MIFTSTLFYMRIFILAGLVLLSFLISFVVACAALTIIFVRSEIEKFPSEFVNALEMFSLSGGGGGIVPACCALVAVTQGAFLVPTFMPLRYGASGATGGRSLRWCVISAAAMAAALSLAWIYALISTIMLYTSGGQDFPNSISFIALSSAFVVGWACWSRYFLRAASRDDPEGWLIRKIFAGTGLLIAATIPLDVMTRRKTDCYCGTGSLFALVWGVGGVYWLLGPFALLGMSRKARRELRKAFCPLCGQARGPTPSATCSECGNR